MVGLATGPEPAGGREPQETPGKTIPATKTKRTGAVVLGHVPLGVAVQGEERASRARIVARATAVVVFPTPPFWLATAITCVHSPGPNGVSRFGPKTAACGGPHCRDQNPAILSYSLAGPFDRPARYTSAGVLYPSDWCSRASL